MKQIRRPLRGAILSVFIAGALLGATPGPEASPHVPNTALPDLAGSLLRAYLDRRPAPALPAGLTIDQGYAIRDRLVAGLVRAWEAQGHEPGHLVGYKAALTNPAVQARFGVTAPIWGVLLAGMLRPGGATVDPRFGSVPLHEGDLVVRVRSAAINRAKDRTDVLAALDAAIPFLELPDLVFGPGARVDGPALAAVNAGARLGILGDPIPLAAGQDWERRLADFTIEVLDGQGATLATGSGRNLLGHPLDVVLWLRDALGSRGVELQPGQLLSLGTVTKLLPATPDTLVRARYTGLDPRGPVEISVRFAPLTYERGRP